MPCEGFYETFQKAYVISLRYSERKQLEKVCNLVLAIFALQQTVNVDFNLIM